MCNPGYTGPACDQCRDGYFQRVTCSDCASGSGPCRSILPGEATCAPFLSGTNECPVYMRMCTEVEGSFAAALSCGACPGTVLDPRTGAPAYASTCSGHGNCAVSGGGLCACDAGWQGPGCAQASPPGTDACANVTCGGAGVCTADGTCACALGWSGPACSLYTSSSAQSRRLVPWDAPPLQLRRLQAQPPGPSPTRAATATWYAGPWFRCSSLCGGGTMTREVSCRAIQPMGAGITLTRGDGTVLPGGRPSAANLTTALTLGGRGAASLYMLNLSAVLPEARCIVSERPVQSAPCNPVACSSAAPDAPMLLFLDLGRALVGAPWLAAGSQARAALISNVHAEVQMLMQRLGMPISVAVGNASVALLPASMVWLDAQRNGTSIMLQLLSAGSVRAWLAAGGGARVGSAAAGAARALLDPSDMPASDAAAQLQTSIQGLSVEGANRTGLRWLSQVGAISVARMDAASLPGVNAALFQPTSAPSAGPQSLSSGSVGGIAAGVVVIFLLCVAAFLIMHRRTSMQKPMVSKSPHSVLEKEQEEPMSLFTNSMFGSGGSGQELPQGPRSRQLQDSRRNLAQASFSAKSDFAPELVAAQSFRGLSHAQQTDSGRSALSRAGSVPMLPLAVWQAAQMSRVALPSDLQPNEGRPPQMTRQFSSRAGLVPQPQPQAQPLPQLRIAPALALAQGMMTSQRRLAGRLAGAARASHAG